MNATTAITKGTLYIVATPIGNRLDITLRALETLKNVDYIAAEDTRHSKPLLEHYGIKKTLIALHNFNEQEKSNKIISDLLNGKKIALISDAGTPLISDPGYPLVKKARENNIPVTPIPGASALIAALSAAGVPCEKFTFCGFLSNKTSKRQEELKKLAEITHTLVLYESGHRILKTLTDIEEIFGSELPITLIKELTKTYEKFLTANAREIINWLSADSSHLKGEFVLIIPPRTENTPKFDKILQTLLKDLPIKQAVKLTAEITNAKKNDIYQYALSLKTQNK